METLELFYPQIAARAGPYSLDAGIEFEIFSAKSSYFDWAKIRFTEQFQPEISLARKDPAAIELGYNGVTEEVFTGFVARPYNKGGGADEITLKDEMLLLEDTQINNTFLDTTPQEVMWTRIGNPLEEFPEWVQPIGAHDAYSKGAKTSHNGKKWVSEADGNVWEPGVYGWVEYSEPEPQEAPQEAQGGASEEPGE